MQAELETTTTETNSPQTRAESKILEPRFAVGGAPHSKRIPKRAA